MDLTARGFATETASESSGSGRWLCICFNGISGAALGTMVANLSSHKPGWDERGNFSDWLSKVRDNGADAVACLMKTQTPFNRILEAFSLPKGNEEEKAARSAAIQERHFYATRIPLETIESFISAFDLIEQW